MALKLNNFFYTKAGELNSEDIKGEWSLFVDDAAPYAEDFIRGVAYLLKDMRLPGLKLAYLEGNLDGAGRNYLLIGSEILPLHRLYLSALPYGTRLQISLYLMQEYDNWSRLVHRMHKGTGLSKSFVGWVAFPFAMTDLMLILSTIPLVMLVQHTKYKGMPFLPEQIENNKAMQEEIAALSGTVQGVVQRASQELLKEVNLDFSRVDIRSRGFLNIG